MVRAKFTGGPFDGEIKKVDWMCNIHICHEGTWHGYKFDSITRDFHYEGEVDAKKTQDHVEER